MASPQPVDPAEADDADYPSSDEHREREALTETGGDESVARPPPPSPHIPGGIHSPPRPPEPAPRQAPPKPEDAGKDSGDTKSRGFFRSLFSRH